MRSTSFESLLRSAPKSESDKPGGNRESIVCPPPPAACLQLAESACCIRSCNGRNAHAPPAGFLHFSLVEHLARTTLTASGGLFIAAVIHQQSSPSREPPSRERHPVLDHHFQHPLGASRVTTDHLARGRHASMVFGIIGVLSFSLADFAEQGLRHVQT